MMGTSTCGIVAVALLLLASGRPTDACSCAPQHPQTAFCYSDAVVRCRIVGEVKVSQDNSTADEPSLTRYQIKVTKIYKGFEQIQDLQFIYTPMLESLCGYNHGSSNRSEEFLFSGHLVDGKMIVNICGFNSPWSKLTFGQKRGLSQIYKTGCTCTIVPCNGPCKVNSPTECLWTDGLLSGTWVNQQAQNLACVQRPNGECSWESLKSQADATTLFKTRRM